MLFDEQHFCLFFYRQKGVCGLAFVGQFKEDEEENREKLIGNGAEFAGIDHGHEKNARIGKTEGERRGGRFFEDQTDSSEKLIAVSRNADKTKASDDLEGHHVIPVGCTFDRAI